MKSAIKLAETVIKVLDIKANAGSRGEKLERIYKRQRNRGRQGYRPIDSTGEKVFGGK